MFHCIYRDGNRNLQAIVCILFFGFISKKLQTVIRQLQM